MVRLGGSFVAQQSYKAAVQGFESGVSVLLARFVMYEYHPAKGKGTSPEALLKKLFYVHIIHRAMLFFV